MSIEESIHSICVCTDTSHSSLRKGKTMAPTGIGVSQATDVDSAIDELWVNSCNDIASINAGKALGT
jgi:hypothetical protein